MKRKAVLNSDGISYYALHYGAYIFYVPVTPPSIILIEGIELAKKLPLQNDDEFMSLIAKQIFSLDKAIRFLAKVDESGTIYALEMKPHVRQRLSDEELEKFIVNWILQIMLFDKYEILTGPLEYYVLKFSNVIGSAIPLRQGPIKSHKTKSGRLFLIMSYEIGTNATRIIEEKIMPTIAEKKDYFV